jgi:hypothetical protein
MAGWLESMSDIMGPALSLGGMAAGGPVGGALGGSLGGMLGAGSTPGDSSSATSAGSQTSGMWNVAFGGKSNLLLIAAIGAAVYFLFLRGK